MIIVYALKFLRSGKIKHSIVEGLLQSSMVFTS